MMIVNNDNFKAEVLESKVPVVIDFFAEWCGPCKMFGPVFEEVSSEQKMNFVKLNVDNYSDIARQYGVMSIPTVILFKDGKEIKRNTGFMSKDDFVNFLN